MSKYDFDFENKTRNALFINHKKKYLVKSVHITTNFTKYQYMIIKKKMKELGIKQDGYFVFLCVMEVIKDLYDEEKVNSWQRLFDDYGDDFSDKSYKSVPY